MKTKLKINTAKLDKILKEIQKKYDLKVGIIGSSSRDDGLTNAEIGAKHEFGSLSERIPRRSFLLDSITEKKKDFTKKSAKIIYSEVVQKTPDTRMALEKIGVVATEIIDDSFMTEGFGKWKPLSPITIEKKDTDAILIETAQLRHSITHKVNKQ